MILAQSFPVSPQMGPFDVVSMLLIVGSAYLVGSDMYSRLFAVQSPTEAKRSTLASAFILVLMAFAITLLGVAARQLYPGIRPEQAIPVLTVNLLPPSYAGLVATALLAAFMSPADTSLMTVTSILTLDIYQKLRPPGAEKERLLKFSRVAVLATGLLALALAVSLPSIIKTLLMVYTIFTSCMPVPVVAGVLQGPPGIDLHRSPGSPGWWRDSSSNSDLEISPGGNGSLCSPSLLRKLDKEAQGA